MQIDKTTYSFNIDEMIDIPKIEAEQLDTYCEKYRSLFDDYPSNMEVEFTKLHSSKHEFPPKMKYIKSTKIVVKAPEVQQFSF